MKINANVKVRLHVFFNCLFVCLLLNLRTEKLSALQSKLLDKKWGTCLPINSEAGLLEFLHFISSTILTVVNEAVETCCLQSVYLLLTIIPLIFPLA